MKEQAARRTYTMGARAEQAARTGERILDAAVDLFYERPSDQIPLDEVARRAGVTVQTVIRRFSGKEGLFAAAAEHGRRAVRDQRDQAPVGNPRRAVTVLYDHYEELGDRVFKLLAEEHRVPGLHAILDDGRAYHRAWCARAFAPALDRLSGPDQERRLNQFVAVCDVYVWKLLRRDGGLTRQQAELAVVELLEPLME
jgi:AcrR family transcriptional regulator